MEPAENSSAATTNTDDAKDSCVNNCTDEVENPELDSFLDNALEGFDTQPSVPDASKRSDVGHKDSSEDPGPWAADFARFEETMKGAIDEDPQLKEQLHKIAESAKKAVSANSDEEFAQCLSETLKTINTSASTFGQPPDEEELTRLMGAMGTGDGEDGFLSMMQNMMQNLLSKEVLYGPLKQITEKYPGWLEEKRVSLPPEEVTRYEKQLSVMKEVCSELEAEVATDAADVKKARFERVLALMQQMHDCGQPPQELIEANPDFQMSNFGFPGLGNSPNMNPEQCCIQ